MPLYEVTYERKKGKHTLTETKHIRAQGETHALQILAEWAAKSFKVILRIIFLGQI